MIINCVTTNWMVEKVSAKTNVLIYLLAILGVANIMWFILSTIYLVTFDKFLDLSFGKSH